MAEKKKATSTKKRTSTRSRKKKKSGFLDGFANAGKIEVIIIAVFFLSFFVWAISKCSSSGSSPSTVIENDIPTSDAAADTPTSPGYDMNTPTPQTNPTATPPATTTTPEPARRQPADTPALYVTLDNLKIRTEPSLSAEVVAILPLHEKVSYGGKKTDFRQKINIGTENTYEPWIYIHSKGGFKGWVYGAGVHYYKWDRLANPIPTMPAE